MRHTQRGKRHGTYGACYCERIRKSSTNGNHDDVVMEMEAKRPGWASDELVAETQREWKAVKGTDLPEEEAVALLVLISELFDTLALTEHREQ